MNAYLITENGKRFITNADNLFDAEEKFVSEFLDKGFGENYKVSEIEISARLQDDETIVFF